MPSPKRQLHYYISIPTVELENGWMIKSSMWKDSHIFFFIYSKYTGQVIIRYFDESREDVAYAFIEDLISRSAKKIWKLNDEASK